MHNLIIAASLAALVAPIVPVAADPPPWAPAHGRRAKDRHEADWQRHRNYDHDRADPRYGGYDADRYYRDGRNYKARRLGNNDRVYRGRDGRYYCRRQDGTTGLIIGGIAGGLLGNTIAPGGSKTLGTILGGGAGALLGRSIDRDGVTCR
jgi:hypothetical protein